MNNLRRLPALFFFAAALHVSAAPMVLSQPDTADASPVTTVRSLDLSRYEGLWYEVAKIPNRFQKQCARGTTAEYALRDDGRITVVNRCIKDDGSTDEAQGVAKVVDMTSNAKLRVSFVSFLGWRPFWGDYWVIGLDADYRWAIIGTPDRKYGWVLSRTPSLDADAMDAIFAIIEQNGYQRSAFATSPHD